MTGGSLRPPRPGMGGRADRPDCTWQYYRRGSVATVGSASKWPGCFRPNRLGIPTRSPTKPTRGDPCRGGRHRGGTQARGLIRIWPGPFWLRRRSWHGRPRLAMSWLVGHAGCCGRSDTWPSGVLPRHSGSGRGALRPTGTWMTKARGPTGWACPLPEPQCPSEHPGCAGPDGRLRTGGHCHRSLPAGLPASIIRARAARGTRSLCPRSMTGRPLRPPVTRHWRAS